MNGVRAPLTYLSGFDAKPVPCGLWKKHVREDRFTRILHGSDVHRQGSILETIAALVVNGRVRPITTTRLNGLSIDAMKTAHQFVETTRTIGKVVIATA